MAKKRSAQLDQEIHEALMRIPKKSVTDLNVFALAQLVLKNDGRPTFSNRLERVDYPHIKRTMAGGLVEVSSPTTLTLTSAGRKAVLHRLRQDYERKPNEKTLLAIHNLEAGT